LAGFSISFSSLSTDCTSYYRPDVSRFLNLYTPILRFNVKYFLARSSFCLPTQDFYSPLCVSTLRLHSFLLKNFYFSQVSLQCFGAAAAIAASSVPVWEQGYTSGSVGGLLEAILRPLGNFGKCLMVLLSLSVAGNNVVTFYSISLNLQAFIPILVVVPRYMFSVVATAV
jgi:hypothetical protein